MEAAITIEEIYSLFAECPVPPNFADFGVFGSEECLPPVGPTKPEGVSDLAPYQAHKNNAENKQHAQIKAESKTQPMQRRSQPNNRRGGWVKAKPVFAPVEVAQGFQDKQLATWGKNKVEAPAQPANQVEFSSLTAAWTTDSSAKSKPKQQSAAPAWGRPIAKPKPSSFADLMERESSGTLQSSEKVAEKQENAWGKNKQQSKPNQFINEKDFPSLSSIKSKK